MLGVIAILAIAAFLVYERVSHKAKVNDAMALARSTSAGIRSTFLSGNYAGLDNATALQAGIILPNHKRIPNHPTSTAPGHPWGGQMTISGSDHTTANGTCVGTVPCTHFRIVMGGVKSDACVDLLTGLGPDFDIIWAVHSGNDQGVDNPNLNNPGWVPDVERIVAACNDADTVNIRFATR